MDEWKNLLNLHKIRISIFDYYILTMIKLLNNVRFMATIICLLIGLTGVSHAIELKKTKIDKKEYYVYTLQREDTNVYELAVKLGIDIDKMKATVFPSVEDGLVGKTFLFFPVELYSSEFENITNNTNTNEQQIPATHEEETIISEEPFTDTPGTNEMEEQREFSVIIYQPFMLEEEPLSKTGQYATEFYKGFVLGIDSLRASYGNPDIKIIASDSGASQNFVIDISFSNVDLIIAPEAENILQDLNSFSKDNSVYVFNVFQSRNSDYLSNPFMLHGNIPTERMYEKAIDWILANLDGALPVILNNEKGKKDKEVFVERLKSRLDQYEHPYKVITYDGSLTTSSLTEELTGLSPQFMFIPTSASLGEFQKFSSAVNNFKSELDNTSESMTSVRLFGYPEFTRFTGDALNKLKSIGTSLYSRFYNDESDTNTQKVNQSYYDRYGEALPDGMPNQALYGFDVANWVLSLAARNEKPTRFVIDEIGTIPGIQTTYDFQPVEGGGFLNEKLYIVTLSNKVDTKIEIL